MNKNQKTECNTQHPEEMKPHLIFDVSCSVFLVYSSLILHPSSLKSPSSLILLLMLLSISVSCGARRTPNLERIFADARSHSGKRPIIIIPGVGGSELVNARTGEVVWPKLFRASDDDLDLPATPALATNRDGLVAGRIVKDVRLLPFLPKLNFFNKLLDVLRRDAGYREGDWDAPAPDGDRDTYYVFAYDWRRDNVETAQLFIRRVEELKRKLGRPELRFNIVAHSMGGLVARYAAMYGDADLAAEGTATPRPTWAGASSINKVFMFGTPNEGSAEAFAILLEGYSLTEGLRPRVRLFNKLTNEDVITVPSVFQLLPHRGAESFLDGGLRPLAVDLYDPAAWRRYGWSPINDVGYRERFAGGAVRSEGERKPLGGTLADVDAYLASVLRRARRFHEALDAVDGAAPSSMRAPVPLFAFGGDCEETLSALVILRDERKNRWVTLTRPRELRAAGNRRISRKEVTRAMYELGDGRVTRRSLLGMRRGAARASALFDTPLFVNYGLFVCDLHSDLQNNRTLQENALTLLMNEIIE
ncbi:MAG: hypothetical protein H0W76_11420 [Pyrinomonadaceae bacterium]|nr:hypothetical protein [Pyrinomonadaceae bacterium]